MIVPKPQYLILKQKILEEARSFFRLEQIKEHFAPVINSNRALGRVKSLACILRLLEERAVLHCKNVTCLEQVGTLLENDRIKYLVHSYKKIYLDGIEAVCICGIQTNFQPDAFPMPHQQEIQYLNQNNNNTADLTDALQNVSRHIGSRWPYLARALGIQDGYIDQIRATYPHNFEQQAREALYLWLRVNENASIELLDTALNTRHCIRHGLGSYLLEPGFVPL